MEIFKGVAAKVAELARQFIVMDSKLSEFEKNLARLQSESDAFNAAVNARLAKLEGQMAAVEESRNSLAEQMRNVKAETALELRAVKAETVAELKTQYAAAQADLYRQFLEAKARLTAPEPPPSAPQGSDGG